MSGALTMLPEAPFAPGSLTVLIVYAVAVSVTPGQNTLHVLSSCKTFGFIRNVEHLLGTLWGTYLTICLVGVVLGGLFAAAPGVQDVIRVSAGFYMLWLAWRLWRNGVPPAVQALRPLRFGEAVLRQLGNSQGWLLAVAVIAGFVPAGDLYLERLLAVALVFCLVMLPALALWATCGTMLHSGMRFRPRLRRGIATVTAAMALLFWI
ncbi:MAG: LysE family translocator [Pseudomonadota bacterium]